jgi:hypothetical protein
MLLLRCPLIKGQSKDRKIQNGGNDREGAKILFEEGSLPIESHPHPHAK